MPSNHGGSRGIQTSHRKMTAAKTIFTCLFMVVGYYYFSSETMLDKYSSPLYQRPSRAISVIESPTRPSSSSSSSSTRQHVYEGLPTRSNAEIWTPRTNTNRLAKNAATISSYQRKHELWKRKNIAKDKLTTQQDVDQNATIADHTIPAARHEKVERGLKNLVTDNKKRKKRKPSPTSISAYQQNHQRWKHTTTKAQATLAKQEQDNKRTNKERGLKAVMDKANARNQEINHKVSSLRQNHEFWEQMSKRQGKPQEDSSRGKVQGTGVVPKEARDKRTKLNNNNKKVVNNKVPEARMPDSNRQTTAKPQTNVDRKGSGKPDQSLKKADADKKKKKTSNKKTTSETKPKVGETGARKPKEVKPKQKKKTDSQTRKASDNEATRWKKKKTNASNQQKSIITSDPNIQTQSNLNPQTYKAIPKGKATAKPKKVADMKAIVELGRNQKETKTTKEKKKQDTVASEHDNKLAKPDAEEAGISALDANISYVHYTGCCGIGHRLARMSNAYHASQRLNFALKGTWPSCDKTNVYEYLFEDDSKDWPAANYARTSQMVKLHNEVPGYATVSRRRSANSTCDTCHPEKIDSDHQFYSQLLQRFRKRDQVQEFLRKHRFAEHTVIGMHTRAGNGERGDFENKNRGIANTTVFVERVRQHVLSLVNDNKDWKDPPLLFLATDTAAMADMLRQAMAKDKIPIVEQPQIRATEGAGILFGDKKNRERRRAQKQKRGEAEETLTQDKEVDEASQRDQCLLGWDQAFMDMMLLASSDVVVATRRSSFVQTIPLSVLMGRKDRKVDKPYCEVSQDSLLEMTCHESYMDWCCCHECVAQEELERRKVNKRRNSEYVKQFRPDLWNTPVMDLYAKAMKPTAQQEQEVYFS